MPSFTREELHDLVWTESRLSLAKRLGVSDVWIRKACVKADIPVPPPGYWARAAAGKKTAREPLPARGLGKSADVTLGRDGIHERTPTEPIEIPPEVQFEESMEVVRRRAELALGRVAVPRGFDRVDPAIEALLKEDEARKALLATDRYSWKKPRFDCLAAQRRLRVLNALLLILAKAGCRGSVDKQDLSLYVRVGDTGIHLELSAKGAKKREQNYFDRTFELADTQKESLMLAVHSGNQFSDIADQWSDADGIKLEQQLPVIAAELLVRGEMQYRADVARHRQWLIEEKARREAEAKRLKLEAERKEAERLARLEKVRQDHLLMLAERLRKSEAIRELVSAVATPERADALGPWRVWALGVADRLDPRLVPIEDLLGRESPSLGSGS